MASKSEKKNVLKMTIESVPLSKAGHKLGEDMPTSLSSSKNKIYYPTVHLSSKDVPGMKGKSAGDYVTIIAYACVKSHTSDERGDDYRLDLEKIGVVSPSSEEPDESGD